jgi:hypothetical protein
MFHRQTQRKSPGWWDIRKVNYIQFKKEKNLNARGAIRTHELLRDWTLNPAPLTWLGNSRILILINKNLAGQPSYDIAYVAAAIVVLFVFILFP